jgi:hypothetical protein
MSSFVKKIVKVDDNLSKVIGVKKGAMVSYAEITKGVYDYIKNHGLKVSDKGEELERSVTPKRRYCFRCGVEVEPRAKYCFRCGVEQ